jgi:hypothetical protein
VFASSECRRLTGREVAESKMPQRKQPTRLEDLAIRQCSNRYISSCQKWIQNLSDATINKRATYMKVSAIVLKECREVAEELSTKPPGVLKLLCPPLVAKFLTLIAGYDDKAAHSQILWDTVRHLSVCTAAFRCVLSRFIERFDSVNTSGRFVRSMVLQNLDRVPGLLELSLCTRNIGDQSELLTAVIHHVKHLQIFKYPDFCNDEVIHQLRLHCPHLTEVDVSYSLNITNASATHLIQFKELQFLNLKGTQIDAENYGFIISELPKIANIRLWQNESSVLYRSGVGTFDSITHIDGNFTDMDTVSRICPNTTNITFSSNFTDLSGLTAFNCLRALEILYVDYNKCNLNAVLRALGYRLRALTLCKCSRVNLKDIATLCPSLVNLSLSLCSFLRFITPLDPQLPHFRNLINLNIENPFPQRVDFRYTRYYVNLETIHLTNVNIFTVEFVREIISLDTFKQLEVFHIEECSPGALTMKALQRLIGHCPLLRRIEGLERCPNLNPRVHELMRQISEQNFDLVIEK